MASKKLTKQIDALLEAEHFDKEVRKELLVLGPDAMELLRQYATGSHPSGNTDIQGRAILALGECGDRSCVGVLKKALRAPDPDVRVRVMRAMGRLGGAEATEAICEVVHDKKCSDVERAHGIRSLGKIKTRKAKEALESLGKVALSKYVNDELLAVTKKKK